MANIKGSTVAKSSPHSSDEASHNDTPSTNLTAFSPESASTATGPRPKFNFVLAEAEGQNFDFGSNVGISANDPFINLPTPTSARSQLSPTADVFTPRQYLAPGLATSSAANNGSHFSIAGAQSGFGGYPVTHGRVSSLVATSIPEAASYQVQTQYGAIGDHPPFSNLCNAMRSLNVDVTSSNVQNFRDATIIEGTFTTDEATTRAFMVTNLSQRETHFCRAAAQFPIRVYPSLTGIYVPQRHQMRALIVGFTDYHDAKVAYLNAQQDHPEWRLVRLSPKAFVLNNDESPSQGRINVAHISDFEGQLIVCVYFNGRDDSIKARPTFELLKQALSTFGEIKAFHSMPYQQGNVREIRVEYYDTRHAENATRSLSQTPLGPVVVSVEYYKPDVQFQDSTRPSATGRSTVPFNDPAGTFGFPPAPYVASPVNDRSRNGRYDASGNHNQVEVYRIQLGLDVRTTIMLRNIPNKVNQAMLKMILDETSRGCYDFMYLRIDFANNCNVGYAFINFVDALAIIPFALARAGQRWNRFNSDKVAEISYATIQGKDCLVQKFRNSSVMLECPTFRPKLFITGSGPDAGEEEHFPPPDNPSKMRRSVENAEHVGLFRHPSRRRNNSQRATTTHIQNRHCLLPATGLRSTTSTNVHTEPHDPFTGIASSSLYIDGKTLKMHAASTDNFISTGLFAPRQGQMYREEQRRRRSQYDRGTPGAEFEAHTQHLTDPALSAYPSSSYPAVTLNTSHYDDLLFPQGAPAPSTWYQHDY